MKGDRMLPLRLDSHKLGGVNVAWPTLQTTGFRRIRSRLRSGQSPASNIAQLQTSFDPKDTIRALRAHRWSVYDAQYLFLSILAIFCLSVIEEPGPLAKTTAAALLMLSLLLPVTRQFFLPALPVFSWLVLFFSCRFIPSEWRPHIWVRVLPALENIVYGGNLSNILSAHQAPILDVLAWLPYGVMHYGTPVVTAIILFIFSAPGSVPIFARSFGYMCIIAVMTQLVFPCAPPWYENMYGLAAANYSISGSPAGLARVDQLFGTDLYTSAFTASPLVFGAMPSLHSGWATLAACFLSNVFPRMKFVFFTYVMWLWWATMYLQHHYAVDLIAGSILACSCFFVAKKAFLPRVQSDKLFRWDYDFVEYGTPADAETRADAGYALADFDDFTPYHAEDDEWSAGYSSGSHTPTTPISPAESRGLWESDTETLGSGRLSASDEEDAPTTYHADARAR